MPEAKSGAADAQNGPYGFTGDTEKMPVTVDAGPGWLVRPKERIVCKKNAGDARDIDAGEGMSRVTGSEHG